MENKTLFVLAAPSGYWEQVFSRQEQAEEWMEINFPPNWNHGYTIQEWVAEKVDPA